MTAPYYINALDYGFVDDGVTSNTAALAALNAALAGTAPCVLSSALTTGTAITSLPVTSLTAAIASPARVTLDDGAGHVQVWTLTASAAIGATSLTVAAQTPNFAYPAADTAVYTVRGARHVIWPVLTAGIYVMDGPFTTVSHVTHEGVGMGGVTAECATLRWVSGSMIDISADGDVLLKGATFRNLGLLAAPGSGNLIELGDGSNGREGGLINTLFDRCTIQLTNTSASVMHAASSTGTNWIRNVYDIEFDRCIISRMQDHTVSAFDLVGGYGWGSYRFRGGMWINAGCATTYFFHAKSGAVSTVGVGPFYFDYVVGERNAGGMVWVESPAGSIARGVVDNDLAGFDQTSLRTALSTGAAITTLPINANTIALKTGNVFTVKNGSHNQVWTLTADLAIGATTASVVSQTPNFAYPPYVTSTLRTALSTGSAITSLPVNALSDAIPSGASVTVSYVDANDVPHSQNWTLTAAAASGATTLTVSSATPNYAYPVGSAFTCRSGVYGGYQNPIINFTKGDGIAPTGCVIEHCGETAMSPGTTNLPAFAANATTAYIEGGGSNCRISNAAINGSDAPPIGLPGQQGRYIEPTYFHTSEAPSWNGTSIAAGATATSTAITVNGAAVGDHVVLTCISTAAPTFGLIYTAQVTAADQVKIYATNPTGAAITPAARTWGITVLKY